MTEIKISEFIEILSEAKDTFGDLSIVVGNKVLKNGSREASAPAVGVSWGEDGKPARFFII